MPVKHHNDDNGKYHKTTVTLTAEPKSNRLSAFHQPTSLEVYSYGATIGSWKVDGTEKLFLSEKAILNGTKAIRGGIPLVFPQFGSKVESQLPQHGFARCSFWKFGSVVADTAEAVTVTFILDQSLVSPELVEMWPHKFELVYTITLSSRTLKTELKVVNKDEKEWSFECLLHTYFLVKVYFLFRYSSSLMI
ncbi:galactose mutarotase-like domain-containing protein [Paraphysoderma sedebokerense]|nr:galactose mutarotase-like domain-containing protein [Paraphysoderma sedebokerense]